MRSWGGAEEIHSTFCERWFSLVVVKGYTWGGRYRKGSGKGRKGRGRGWGVRLYQGFDSEMDRGGGREKIIKKTIGEIKNLWQPGYGEGGLLISITLSFHALSSVCCDEGGMIAIVMLGHRLEYMGKVALLMLAS